MEIDDPDGGSAGTVGAVGVVVIGDAVAKVAPVDIHIDNAPTNFDRRGRGTNLADALQHGGGNGAREHIADLSPRVEFHEIFPRNDLLVVRATLLNGRDCVVATNFALLFGYELNGNR